MRTPRLPWSLALLVGASLASWAPLAFAEEAEEEVDELPSYVLQELDGAWDGDAWGEDAAAAPAPRPVSVSYGSDIPSPEDVMHNRASSRAAPPGQAPAPAPAASTQGPVGSDPTPVFDDFYQGLSSHGRWVETPEHGWVFVPDRQREVSGWRPYLYGQWTWTRYGWTWVSEEPFGWATYHYGRWNYSPAWGWSWVPGYVWGPAWVAWRHGAGSIGWAPLYPGYVSFTVGYPVHYDHWIFVGNSHFYGSPVHRHWVVGSARRHWSDTRWASHWRSSGTVYAGPPRGRIEQRIGRPVREVRIVRTSAPSGRGLVRVGNASEVRVYQPGRQVRSGGPDRRAPVQRRPGSGLAREAPAMRDHRPVRAEPRSQGAIRPAPVMVSPGRTRDGASRNERAAPAPSGLRAVPAPRAAPSGRDATAPRSAPRGSRQGSVAPAPAPLRVAPGGSQQGSPQRLRPEGATTRPAPRAAPGAPVRSAPRDQRRQVAPSAPSGGALRPRPATPSRIQAAPAPTTRSSLRATPAPRPALKAQPAPSAPRPAGS